MPPKDGNVWRDIKTLQQHVKSLILLETFRVTFLDIFMFIK